MKEKLKELRNKKGVTQKELSDFLKISRSTYNNYEQGVAEPDIETIKKLAKYYNVTTDTILENENKNLIDMSTMTNRQREIVDIIKDMDDEQCRYTLAYIEGFKKAIEERNQKFNQGGNRE